VETGAVLGKSEPPGALRAAPAWGLTVERARVNPLLLVKLLSNPPSEETRKKPSGPGTN